MNTRRMIMNSVKGFMKMVCMVATLLVPCVSQAAFVSGSTGADGDFNPTANIAVQIPESGVLNYGTVTIPSNVYVTFKKNSQNTPVTILATGNVTISGTVSVNGAAANGNAPGAGGPGGFGGGIGGYIGTAGFRGQGPGAGGGATSAGGGAGGGFGLNGSDGTNGYACSSSGVVVSNGGLAYGNAGLVPLIGGSGGGGASFSTAVGGAGGGGGGAILIASSGTINIAGSLTAIGGNGINVGTVYGGGGSGGAIRVIANVITGEGAISAAGGTGGSGCSAYFGGPGGNGKIRLEGWQINRSTATTPAFTPYLYPVAVGPDTVPSLTITQINDIAVSSSPAGVYKSPDVTLPYNATGPVTVTVSALNVPTGKTVTVRAMPEIGNSVITATGTLSGSLGSSSVQIQLSTVKGAAYLLSASVNY